MVRRGRWGRQRAPWRAACSRRDATSLLLCNEKQVKAHILSVPEVPPPRGCRSPFSICPSSCAEEPGTFLGCWPEAPGPWAVLVLALHLLPSTCVRGAWDQAHTHAHTCSQVSKSFATLLWPWEQGPVFPIAGTSVDTLGGLKAPAHHSHQQLEAGVQGPRVSRQSCLPRFGLQMFRAGLDMGKRKTCCPQEAVATEGRSPSLTGAQSSQHSGGHGWGGPSPSRAPCQRRLMASTLEANPPKGCRCLCRASSAPPGRACTHHPKSPWAAGP